MTLLCSTSLVFSSESGILLLAWGKPFSQALETQTYLVACGMILQELHQVSTKPCLDFS